MSVVLGCCASCKCESGGADQCTEMTKRSISGAAVVVWEDFMIDTIAKCLGACDTDCPRLQPKFSSHLFQKPVATHVRHQDCLDPLIRHQNKTSTSTRTVRKSCDFI